MNPPVINSTNSVSTTRRKREAERSVNWTVEETEVLLCVWSDERVQKSLAENLRNRHVFKHLSARLSEMGFSRSPHQCRLRVKTLKANYVRAKLQRGAGGSQPCSFKYFAEMDAVLGRRSAGGGGQPYFVPPERTDGRHVDSADRTGSFPLDLDPGSEVGGHQFVSLGRTAARGGSQVKLEDGDVSTDEFDFVCPGAPIPRIDMPSTPEFGFPGEDSLNSPPPPPPLTTQSAASPPPAPPDPSPGALPTPGHRCPASPCLEPVLRHLSACFQRLVSESRGLLVQLEGQRQEQARGHQELLAQWLQREERREREAAEREERREREAAEREERREREAAEREERREKARMEHEIRVLELLTGLARERRCGCGGGGEAPHLQAGKGGS